jgi:hypothetical protein
MRLLRAAAAVELVTLIALFTNLATYHQPTVAALLGPLHGCAYLYVAIAVARAKPSPTTRTKLTAVIPAVGGLLALRHLPAPSPRPAP